MGLFVPQLTQGFASGLMDDSAVLKNYITRCTLSDRIVKIGVVESGSSGGEKSNVDTFGE